MAKDYSHFSKEELIKKIEKLESRKKYGLIWDEERTKEKFEKDAENALPVLKEISSKEITDKDQSKPVNILIEGDNYHALSVLNFTHQGKVDLIYIDPPYNTGNKDFKYNDNYIDREDAYRHSKWLSFMNKRLILAKNLLKENGVIFISIDDNEIAQLKLLCDEIFQEQNFLALIAWQSTDTLRNDAKYFSANSEFVLCYAKNKTQTTIKGIVKGEKQKSYYKNDDKDERGAYLLTPLHAKSGSEASIFEYKFKNGQMWKPPKGTFPRFSKETLKRLESEGRIWLDPTGRKVPQRKTYLSEVSERMPLWTFWRYEDFGSTRQSNQEISDIIGKGEFQNPKPTKLIKIIIDSAVNKDGIILDFFAGSGTTGHAALSLNKEDGGNRKFILCTNNESNIATDVCYPRIKKVIKGFNSNPGLGGNLKYFKTSFVKKGLSKDDLKIRLTRECTEMLCLREGIFDEIKSTADYKIFKQGDRVMGIYYSLNRDALKSLKKDLDKTTGDKTLYCFTIDPLGLDKNDFTDWDNVTLEPIPQKILDVYDQIYEY